MQLDILESIEMDFLKEKFRVNKDMDQKHSIAVSDFLREQGESAFLNDLTEMLPSPSLRVTVSQFTKRYAFLVIAPGLYAMSMYDKGLDLSFENCRFDYQNDEKAWLANIHLQHFQVTKPTEMEIRDVWRDQVIKHIFADHITKLWHALAKSTSSPKAVLWENAAIRIFSLYEKRMGDSPSNERRKLIQDDFMYLISEAPGALFGETSNPLTKFYRPKSCVNENESPVRIRKTCCYFYELGDGEYCSTCPLIKRW